MSLNNLKNKIRGAVPAIGLFMTATGLVSVIYWNYLGSVNANSKEALSIGHENKAEISALQGQMKEVVDNSKYIRDKVDEIAKSVK